MTPEEHVLSCLAEECAEVAHRVSKALRFGVKEVQHGQVKNNAERIADELNDLRGVVELLLEMGVLPSQPAAASNFAVQQKKNKVRDYMNYARAVGTVT